MLALAKLFSRPEEASGLRAQISLRTTYSFNYMSVTPCTTHRIQSCRWGRGGQRAAAGPGLAACFLILRVPGYAAHYRPNRRRVSPSPRCVSLFYILKLYYSQAMRYC